jgi:hypothetical protein
MPSGKLPEQFGTGEIDFPEDFWGQFLHPFRKQDKQQSREANPLRLGTLRRSVAEGASAKRS